MNDVKSVRILFILLVLSIACTDIQAQRFGWAKNFQSRSTSDSPPSSNTVAVGSHGRIFLGGYFIRTLDVDGILLDAGNRQDGFFVELDSTGTVLSAQSLETSIGGSLVYMQATSHGDLIMVGEFEGTISLGSYKLTTDPGSAAYFVAKRTQTGEFLWAKKFEWYILKPVLDSEGNIYFINSVTWSPLGLQDEYLTKLDRNGDVIYKSLIYHRTNTSSYQSAALAVDPFGNVYLGGHAANPTLIGDIMFDADPFGTTLIVKCNKNGVVKKIKMISDIGMLGGHLSGKMITDGIGSLYHVERGDKLSISKYDSAGNLIWSQRNDQSNITVRGLQLDELGNLYVTGQFQGNFSIANQNFTSVGQSIFVAKFNNAGAIQWKVQGQNEYWDHAMDISRYAASGDIYIAGIMQSLAPTFGDNVLQSLSLDTDVLIFQVKDNVVPHSLSVELGPDTTLCEGETLRLYVPGFAQLTWQDGSHGSYFSATSPGKYYVTALDYLGQQYADTLNIAECVIPPVDPGGPQIPGGPQGPEAPNFNPLTIPNVITPNNDALNDFFVVGNLDVSKLNSLAVFDRWGKKVFSADAYQNNWDACQLPSGVYFYKLTDGRDLKSYIGWLHVLK